MTDLGFPLSRSLPPLLSPEGWSWHYLSNNQRFWIGEDLDGLRWLVKFRGGFYAVRERGFSIIAQALGISCQSSTFLKVPQNCLAFQQNHPRTDYDDAYQLATWFFDEHEPSPAQTCIDCPLETLNRLWESRPYDVGILHTSSVAHAIDIARGEMLGMLCEMHEPPGRLFTRDHRFVQIDNELMFSNCAGAKLCDSPWVMDDGNIRQSGLDEAIHLCKQVLSLPDEIFDEAIRLPPGYCPRMCWSVQNEIYNIQPRARKFLKMTASLRRRRL